MGAGAVTDRDEQNRRYVDFRCCDCGHVRYSAGRPRCAGCHAEYLQNRIGDNTNA